MERHRTMMVRAHGHVVCEVHQTEGTPVYVVMIPDPAQQRLLRFTLEALQRLVAQVEAFAEEAWE